VVMIATSWFLLVLGGHVVWQLRRQLFEAREIGRYKLKERIGRGGMGEVWRASHVGLKRDVAVKILRSGSDHIDEAVARFEREVRATTELRHPNTVRIHDYGTTDDGLWFYAMEYLEGETLGALIERESPLDAQRTIRIALQVGRALAEAHEHGIVHRDVKPENVFLTEVAGERDFVKVLDFGIAREIASAPGETLTLVGSVVGTPAFMAPEQATGANAEPASDVYSLGAVIYKCLTGHAPFEKATDAAVLEAQLSEPLPPMSAWAQVPPDLEQVVVRCLAKRAEDRYAHGGELADALAACAIDLDPLSRRMA
jgi:eukaryotic-like serine/threonine-protein kinase